MTKKPSARGRSPFGQFQMHKSHLKTGGQEPLRVRPKATEMAEMRRAGLSLAQVAEAVGLSVSTVRQRLNESGFRSSGEPR